MSASASYCDECGAESAIPVVGADQPAVEVGELAVYHCRDCPHAWIAIVPEPRDGYKGDGVFAANH